MPQPIHYSELISFDFSPEAVLQRPKLAPHIAAISASWNEIEALIATLLAALLGGEAKTVISIFFAIRNDGAKKAATDAICSLKLSPDDHKTLQAILKTVGERYTDRNSAIHGAWGVSPQYPDKLLWADIPGTIKLHVEMMGLPGSTNREARIAVQIAHQKTMQIWSEKDFTDTEERLRATHKVLQDFCKPIIDGAFGPSGGRLPVRPH